MSGEVVTLPELTRQQIARYAGAVRDFNPIHVDEEFAKAAGMPSAIAHGPLTLARALDVVVAAVGAARVRALDARLLAPYLPGQPMSIVGDADGFELRDGSGTVLATVRLDYHDEATE